MQAHERRPQQVSLIGETRADGFGDNGPGGRVRFRVHGLVAFGIERIIRRGGKRRQANAARGIAAGILKLGHLLGHARLAGALGGGV